VQPTISVLYGFHHSKIRAPKSGSGQHALPALHLQLRRFDYRQSGLKIALRRDQNFQLRRAYRRLMRLGLGKCDNATCRHD
jgi:hypothetical protein